MLNRAFGKSPESVKNKRTKIQVNNKFSFFLLKLQIIQTLLE